MRGRPWSSRPRSCPLINPRPSGDLPRGGVRLRDRDAWRLPGLVLAQAQPIGTRAVIVGAGPAGDAVAAGLRDGGFAGEITLIGAERQVPYERPHLSKGYLLGTIPLDRLPLRPVTQYQHLGVELVLGEEVRDLGVANRRVVLDSGKTIGWDLICVTVGSDARRLGELGDAMYLRDLDQAEHLRSWIDRGEPLNILGAGFIGCEVAAVARQKGCEVRVEEVLEQPVLRVLGPELGAYFAGVHRAHGVDLRLNVRSPAKADLVAIGSAPRLGLAEQSGLETDGGIVVDQLGRTSESGVYAAGDVTRFFHPLLGARIRVEHFQTAQRQGFAVGRTMAGVDTPYVEVPWFWSDQYDVNLQYVGAGLRWDQIVIRGELGEPPFTVFYLRGGALIGAAGINDHHTVARTRHVMEARRPVSPQQLADRNFDLRRAIA